MGLIRYDWKTEGVVNSSRRHKGQHKPQIWHALEPEGSSDKSGLTVLSLVLTKCGLHKPEDCLERGRRNRSPLYNISVYSFRSRASECPLILFHGICWLILLCSTTMNPSKVIEGLSLEFALLLQRTCQEKYHGFLHSLPEWKWK